jgi:malyl-CoA/(S)-citramalyl-CoA lyase
MIHFLDASNPKMTAKVPDLVQKCDVILGNLEDAIPSDRKIEAREGLIKVARDIDFGDCQLWTRVNSLDSPWALDDLLRLVTEIGELEAKAGLKKPLLLHAILETHLGVVNVEAICDASPRMQGLSFGPADLAASRRMKTTRVGGGHPGYLVRTDPDPDDGDAPRITAQQDPWHYTLARMVDACTAHDCLPYYGPFGDIKDTLACEDQFRASFLLGCVGAWSLHPAQIEIARRVFSPEVEEVRWARRVIEQMGDGTGVVMIDGKMQDDATYKQCQVMVNYAKLIARKDPEYREAYGFSDADLADTA